MRLFDNQEGTDEDPVLPDWKVVMRTIRICIGFVFLVMILLVGYVPFRLMTAIIPKDVRRDFVGRVLISLNQDRDIRAFVQRLGL